MTSGNFSKFPVDQIHVDRDVRQRRELTDIDDLADSIKRTGLINPIVTRKSGVTEMRWSVRANLSTPEANAALPVDRFGFMSRAT